MKQLHRGVATTMANIRQIAKQAGVSITTVSRVLNNHPRVSDEARQRVLAVTRANGYAPAVGRKPTSNIALAYIGGMSLESPFDAALMAGMVSGMEGLGYDLMILDVARSRLPHETYSQMFLRRGIRAAVLRMAAANRHVCKAIADEGFPAVVAADRFDDAPNVSFVDYESRTPSREAVAHLIALGHRRIAVATNVIDDTDHTERVAGYRDALAESTIEFDERLVIRVPASREGGEQVVRRLGTLADPPPTAVYVTDPLTAIGAMNEARRMGIGIPEDLSLVGFDDGEVRHEMLPRMSAVCQDATALGAQAVAALHQMLEASAADAAAPCVVRKTLRAWFEIHGSTAPAPRR